MLWGPDNQDNLYWGSNIGFTKADVDEATRSLFVRYDDQGGDFSQEIAVYEASIQTQKALLVDLAGEETASMLELADLLK
jgi:trans-2-enoyl-CoA reductase